MKSIAGSILVLAGALIIALRADDIPNEPLPTAACVGLFVLGLYLVFKGDDGSAGNKLG